MTDTDGELLPDFARIRVITCRRGCTID